MAETVTPPVLWGRAGALVVVAAQTGRRLQAGPELPVKETRGAPRRHRVISVAAVVAQAHRELQVAGPVLLGLALLVVRVWLRIFLEPERFMQAAALAATTAEPTQPLVAWVAGGILPPLEQQTPVVVVVGQVVLV